MRYTVEYTARARKELGKMDPQQAARVTAAVDRLAETGHGDTSKLTDVDPPEYRLRVGDWRVRFAFAPDQPSIRVLRVLPRGKAYR